jgi:nitroreductase
MTSVFFRLMNNRSVETIQRRRSVRTYSSRPMDAETKEEIRQVLRDLSGPFEGRLRCKLVEKKDAALEGVKLGTYGVILGASTFVAAVVERGDRATEQVGHVFEQAVLYLTSRGLGTCWLGGTFRRSAFAHAVHLSENEMLPVITPVGYASRIRGPIDMLFKPSLARRRAPWQSLFFDEHFGTPLDETLAWPFKVPLKMVRLAPSASNKQPWRILRKNGSFLFYLAGDPVYRRRYEFDIQKIDMGIAMLHFEAAAREAGLNGHWESPQRRDQNHQGRWST